MLHPSLRCVLITVPVQVGNNPDQSRDVADEALRAPADTFGGIFQVNTLKRKFHKTVIALAADR
jgi:hypothetical protein